MNAEKIWHEYETNKRLSDKALLSLKALLYESSDPYSAITLAGDVAAVQLASEVATHLTSMDAMVRWNAAAVLFGRFRDVRYGRKCLDMLSQESDSIALGVVLSGAGELLPLLDDKDLKRELALKIYRVFCDSRQLPEIRTAAYEGIQAATGIPLRDRISATVILDVDNDANPDILNNYREMYGIYPGLQS